MRSTARVIKQLNPQSKPEASAMKSLRSLCLELGRAGTFYIRDLRFESSQWQLLFPVNCIEKSEIKRYGVDQFCK